MASLSGRTNSQSILLVKINRKRRWGACPHFFNRAREVNQALSLGYRCNIKHFVEAKAKMCHSLWEEKRRRSNLFHYEEDEITKSIPTRALPPSTLSRWPSGLHSASVTTAQSYARELTQKSLDQLEMKSRRIVACSNHRANRFGRKSR